MTLFLLTSVNARLRPKLRAELRSGTRVVSNTFDMGDWKPDKVERVFAAGPPASILLYTFAPDLLLGWTRSHRPEECVFLGAGAWIYARAVPSRTRLGDIWLWLFVAAMAGVVLLAAGVWVGRR